ncbi:MAG: sugar transferase [Eubacteriales bacterium]
MGNRQSKANVLELYVLQIVDIITIIFSYGVASYLRYGTLRSEYEMELYNETLLFLIIFSIVYTVMTNYSQDFMKRGYMIELVSSTKYHGIMLVAIGTYLFLTKNADPYSRLFLAYFFVCNYLLSIITHDGLKFAFRKYYSDSKIKQKTVIITTQESIQYVMKQMSKNMDYMHEIVGIVIWDAQEAVDVDSVEGVQVVGANKDYLKVMTHMVIDEVFIYLPKEEKEILTKLVRNLESMGVICHYAIDVANIDSKARVVESVGGFTVISYSMAELDYHKRMVKRCMDILAGLIGTILVMLMFPILAIIIRVESKGPILFRQNRVGKNGRIFSIYKFRSMYIDAEERKQELMDQNQVKGLMFKLEDDPRITKVGKFIRKTSLDEFPQFINILKGDMSLVGTRPPTVDEYEEYNYYYKRRLSMTPGLTGLWQVSGRSEITDFDDVVKYDLEYIDNWSLTLDMKIVLKTFGVVLFAKGSK